MATGLDENEGIEGQAIDQGTRETSSDESASSSTICWACKQPIEGGQTYHWRGEPVHRDCEAELQCGVRLKIPPASED